MAFTHEEPFHLFNDGSPPAVVVSTEIQLAPSQYFNFANCHPVTGEEAEADEDAECDGLVDALGDVEAEGETDGEVELDGDTELLGETEGEAE